MAEFLCVEWTSMNAYFHEFVLKGILARFLNMPLKISKNYEHFVSLTISLKIYSIKEPW